MASTEVQKVQDETQIKERKGSQSSVYSNEKTGLEVDPELQTRKAIDNDDAAEEESKARRKALYAKFRPFILGGIAAVILGWWISATVLKATRHRWFVPISLRSIIFDANTPSQIRS